MIEETRFESTVDGEPVPGLLWTPSSATGPLPAVLLGHGRTADKRMLDTLAHAFVRRGLAAVAIDAPGHGERRVDPDADWPRPDAGQAAREWRAGVGMLVDHGRIDGSALGYWGVSMGASLGISFLAESPGIRAAVLGLMHPNWPAPPGDRIRADARRLTCPVLFLVNWDDQLVPVAQAGELFDLIGSTDKRLHAYPGGHGQLPQEAITASEEFLTVRLEGAPGAG
ncbi:MAG TPA: alpha/beta hydrolase [Pseudonocardiaceae bacterium]|nr:alpha/beta hydrolase [Pseudonocardiaceae bacterium]